MAEQNPPEDPQTGTTREKDFGRTDRYENKDEPGFNVRHVGDDTARDSGRGAAKAKKADPDDPSSPVNRDE